MDIASRFHTFADLDQARTQRIQLTQAPATWEAAGPTNIGGRMTCVAVHPEYPDIVWAGSAGGGVWKSEDAGSNWKPLWHDQESLVVGALALDPKNPDRIFCGTGEANLTGDSYPGVGLYLSEDGGETWRLIASPKDTRIPTRISTIAIDPADSLHILIGGLDSWADEAVASHGGLYVSHNGGIHWTYETFASKDPHRCHSVVFDPARPCMIFAALSQSGINSGIWRTRDNGKSWEHLTEGLPDPESFGRTSIAIAPSKTDVIYAFAADAMDEFLGVFRSPDGGDHWEEIGGSHFKNAGGNSHANAIAVHPGQENFLICGAQDIHLTRNGGSSWIQATHFNIGRGHPLYAHADHHSLAIINLPGGTDRVYDLNDGGMDISENGGRTWRNRSDGLAVTQYYTLDVAPSDQQRFGGGTQDNGALITLTGGSGDHFEVLSGDGGGLIFAPKELDLFYVSAQELVIFRWQEGSSVDVSPIQPPDQESKNVFGTLLTLAAPDAFSLFTASNRIFKTDDMGGHWSPVSPPLDGSIITAIEVAAANTKQVYAGTENGGLFRSLDKGAHWGPDLAKPILPGKRFNSIKSSPVDSKLVLAAVGGFGNPHLFLSLNGGRKWQDVDRGDLPDAPLNAIAFPLAKPGTVYVAGDAGVFVGDPAGGDWKNLTGNLPNVRVTSLVFHEASGILFAATYGRGIWKLKTP